MPKEHLKDWVRETLIEFKNLLLSNLKEYVSKQPDLSDTDKASFNSIIDDFNKKG